VCDNGVPSLCDTVTVNFTVNAVNDAPVGVADAYITDEDVAVLGNVLANDTDVEGDALTASLVTAPVNGNVVLNTDGSFTYTPNANFYGLDSLQYRVCDNGVPSLCDTVTVNFTVNAVNDAPVGVADAYVTDEDVAVLGNVLTNDTDVEGDALTASLVTAPVNGNVVLNTDGSFTYTPNVNFYGFDSLHYQVCDNGVPSLCDTVTVTFTVNAVNDAPVGVGDAYITDEDVAVLGNVLTNDTDVEGDALTVSLITAPVNGNVVLNADGSFTYTPNANFYGFDSLHYRVCDNGVPSMCDTATVVFTVNAVNDAPTAGSTPLNVSTPEDTPYNGAVIGYDADGDALTYGPGTQPTHGNLIVNPDGTYIYTPDPNYNGQDTYTIIITDAHGASTTVTITIDVNAVNDAPTSTNQTFTTPQNTVLNGTITANDLDGDVLNFNVITNATNGFVVVNTDGTFIYTSVNDYHGPDSFTVEITDGNGGSVTVIITIDVIQVITHPAITLVKQGVLAGNTITYSFTVTNTGDVALSNIILGDPMVNLNITLKTGLLPGEVITQTITYTLTQQDRENGTVSNTATVSGAGPDNVTVSDISGTTASNNTPTVITVPSAPHANDDESDTRVNIPVTIPILDNDDPVNSTFVLSMVYIITQPQHGQVIVNEDGTVIYTPEKGYDGDDAFTYQVTDADGYVTNIAAVTIHIKETTVKFPTLFTPNGDGKNDVLEIGGLENYTENELIIVNRWGNEVYRQRNYSNNWSGDGLNEGTYYYLLRVKKPDGTGWEVFKGFTTILRKFKK
jgi:gliding motility-associated-like protein